MFVLQDHPKAVEGAAKYYASGNDVVMLADGYYSTIDTKPSHESALKAAKRWQEKENKTVTREAKRLAKLAGK